MKKRLILRIGSLEKIRVDMKDMEAWNLLLEDLFLKEHSINVRNADGRSIILLLENSLWKSTILTGILLTIDLKTLEFYALTAILLLNFMEF